MSTLGEVQKRSPTELPHHQAGATAAPHAGKTVLFAARCLEDRPEGLHTMEDILQPYFGLEPSRAAVMT